MAYTKQELGREFWLLTKGILQDSTIDTDEALVLKRWLEEHRDGDQFEPIIETLDKCLRDGYIDRFESQRLTTVFGHILAELRA